MENIQQIAVGSYTCYALRNDGKLFTWGKNNYGQCAAGSTTQDLKLLEPIELNLPYKVIDVFAGEDHGALINNSGEAYTWGYGLV